MGRGTKKVFDSAGIDRRTSGYYSTPGFVADFIANEILRIKPDIARVLDPCVGKEELTGLLEEKGKDVDSFDIFEFKSAYESNFQRTDFIEFYEEQKGQCILGSDIDLPYDAYIANPPYNCHEVDYIRKSKKRLKSLFPDVGVHNMYSMFISAMIDCAKQGAVIGFITLDSFLTARAHSGLRKKIHDECSIHTIALCPTDLFLDQGADVRTCIMVLQKGTEHQGSVRTANRPRNTKRFQEILANDELVEKPLSEIVLESDDDLNEIVIGCPSELWGMFSLPRLGNLFRCVTGISTADDKKYISPRRSEGFAVPFFKNPGKSRFYTEPNGYIVDNFLEVDSRVPNFQVRNKDILFKEGITCSSMGVPFTACYLPPNSTFGVNANIICSQSDIWWLIGYLNSSLVTYLVRGVLIRTNMVTSGYVSRIPIPCISSSAKERLEKIAKQQYENKAVDALKGVAEIDKVLFDDLGITKSTQDKISTFCGDILRLT